MGRPPQRGGPARHGVVVVQPGDTLYSIAFRNNMDYHDLAAWNHIDSHYTIYPGQRLRIAPATGTSPPPTSKRSATAPSVAVARPPSPSASPSLDATPAPPGSPVFNASQWRWPAAGKVVQHYNPGQGSKGIDIAGHDGETVVATAPGKVVYSGSALKGYGELIIIKHDERYLSAYGYNRRRLVKEGQWVHAGQPIAEMGEGPQQRVELHFEIRDRGRPIDPLGLLPRR